MSSAAPMELVLAKLKKVQKTASGYQACCPAHEDHDPSLSISRGDDGRVLLRCHAGCTVDAICKAIGIHTRDLFCETSAPRQTRKRKETKGRIVATYDYVDPLGSLLFQTVRFEPKGFSQRRPNGKIGWTWNLKGACKVLYRLPVLLV